MASDHPQPSSSCGPGYVRIDSEPASVATGFMLEAGKHYSFKTTGKWEDSDKLAPCDADGYEKWYLYAFFFLRTFKTAPWFCLIGIVDGKQFRMGAEGNFVSERSGELFCFANDAPFKRRNNYGWICLKVWEEE